MLLLSTVHLLEFIGPAGVWSDRAPPGAFWLFKFKFARRAHCGHSESLAPQIQVPEFNLKLPAEKTTSQEEHRIMILVVGMLPAFCSSLSPMVALPGAGCGWGIAAAG
jgi:hypothetical protein